MAVRWTAAAALFGMAACLIARDAAAERVLLLRPLSADAALDEAFNRLRAELELNEFEVVTVDEGPEGGSRSLAVSAQRAGAFAAVAWVRRDAEVWISAGPPGQATERFLE